MSKKVVSKSRKTTRRKKTEPGDVIRIQDTGPGAAIAAGRNATASVITNESIPSINTWVTQINKQIEALMGISQAEKEDLKQQIAKIGEEAQKGRNAELGRLEKLINTLSVMAPDIFDTIITTLASPLAGIGLIIKKIGDKAKLEKDSFQA